MIVKHLFRILIISVILFFISCGQPVGLVDSVDGPDGIPLSISPVTSSVATTDTITLTAFGGVSPYTFSIISDLITGGSGTIDADTGVYTAPGQIGTVTVQVEDSIGALSTATIEVIQSPDYTVNFSPTAGSVISGATISESLTITNGVSNSGSENISWIAYLSTNNTLNTATDTVIDAGSISGLAGGATSSVISFTGNWPQTQIVVSYYLIVSISAGDDLISANDVSVSNAYTVNPLNIDYEITNLPTGGTYTAGDSIAESFTIRNAGTNNGGNDVYWTAYISVDNTLEVGTDTVIDTGSITSLNSGITSSTISFIGNWPQTDGTYYLLISISAGDDLNSTNDVSPSPAFTIDPLDINYDITSMAAGGTTFTVGDPISETFVITNTGADDGSENILWIAYISSNNTVEVGTDVIVDAGIESSLNSLVSSANITITGNWPLTAGFYYLIVTISAGDDVIDTANNVEPSGLAFTIDP